MPMRVAVLSASPGWHVRDLCRAGSALGHWISVHEFTKLADRAADRPHLSKFDAVLVRMMPAGSLEQVAFRLSVLHRLHASGVRVVNRPAALETCMDKYMMTVRLAGAGLPVPATAVCQRTTEAMAALERLGGDVVVKPLFGSEGRGIVRVSDPDLAWRTFRAVEQTRGVIYLQRFVPHHGYDLRAFVLGGRLLAAMRRTSADDWRTNVARGARAETVTLSDAQEELAVRAAAAVGADVAGVDLLPDAEGSLFVLEVNGVPGWRALSAAARVDVAAAVLRWLGLSGIAAPGRVRVP
jgi:ribosomal protein S6--L-glutamate ligase